MEKIRSEIKDSNIKSNNLYTNHIGRLWDELDIAPQLWKEETSKFYFKDILNIMRSNPNISNFYIKNVNKFLNNRSTIFLGNIINVR